jgi:ribosome-associated protein
LTPKADRSRSARPRAEGRRLSGRTNRSTSWSSRPCAPKAVDAVLLDLREVASFTDFFVIVGGTNARQVQAIADGVEDALRRGHGRKPARVEGYNSAEWVLLDYGDFILHVFEEKARRFYDLERLWRDAARVSLPADLAGAAPEGSQGAG